VGFVRTAGNASTDVVITDPESECTSETNEDNGEPAIVPEGIGIGDASPGNVSCGSSTWSPLGTGTRKGAFEKSVGVREWYVDTGPFAFKVCVSTEVYVEIVPFA